MRELGYPVVPMPVHQVFRNVRRGLVQFRIGVRRLLYVAMYIADIHYLALVRRKFEIADSCRNVAHLHPLHEFRRLAVDSAQCSFPYLPSLDVGDAFSAVNPSGAADALSVLGQLSWLCPVCIDYEQIAAASILLDRGVAHAVEDVFSVWRKLRIREPSECQKGLRSHFSILDFDLRRSDVVRRLFFTCTVHCQSCADCQCGHPACLD